MSVGCFSGRGSLAVSPTEAAGAFFTLSGESEISILFEEDNESVFDAREGVNERVDWYVRNFRCRVEAECFRISEETLELLLKAAVIDVPASADPITLPILEVGKTYLLRPKCSSVAVEDSNAVPISSADYVVEESFGTITFSAVTGQQPYVVSLSSAGHTQFCIGGENQIEVQALIRGINKADGKEFMAHFYRLALDITEEMKLVQKGFLPLTIRMHCLPDMSQPVDPQLGQYGRLILL